MDILKDMKDELERKTRKQVIVENIPIPDKTDEEQQRDYDLLIRNLDLLISNSKLIIGKPEYYHIRMRQLHLGTMLTGTTYLPLGFLLKLWNDNEWIGRCPDCGSKVYITSAGGSPLSGRHSYSGYCRKCGKHISSSFSSFGVLLRPVFESRGEYSNTRKYIKTHSQFFSWKYGLIGEPVHDEIIDEGVKPVELSELIAYLRQQ